jgi:hypothetical protein
MANTVKGSVILESIAVRSPGVGSMWEFTFWVNRKEQPAFMRVIKDGQEASFRKTLFAADLPVKKPKAVEIQVAVREIDPKTSDYGNGGTTISIDTTFSRQTRESFQAQVTEKGGTRAGAVATLTFNLVSEVRGDTACDDCDKELKDAARIPDEFETVAGELLGMLIPGQLASDFGVALGNYSTARATLDMSIGAWDRLAKRVRDCAAQNPRQVKAICLRRIDRIESLDDEMKNIASDLIPLLGQREVKLAERYRSFLTQERFQLQIALYEAELDAKCLDKSDLDKARDKLKAAKQGLKDESQNLGDIATDENVAAREAKKMFSHYRTLRSTRENAAADLQGCANNQSFGSCSAQAQALLSQDAQVAASLIQVQQAYEALDTLLETTNSQLNQTDDRLDLLVDNYTDALKEYTDCVARLQM